MPRKKQIKEEKVVETPLPETDNQEIEKKEEDCLLCGTRTDDPRTFTHRVNATNRFPNMPKAFFLGIGPICPDCYNKITGHWERRGVNHARFIDFQFFYIFRVLKAHRVWGK